MKKSNDNFTVCVGYDSRHPDVFNTCVNSIKQNTKSTVNIKALNLLELQTQGYYYREYDNLSSTEFSFSRFLVPHLFKNNGWVLFCDSDFIFLEDVEALFKNVDDKYAVMCVKHDYLPKNEFKMNDQKQSLYPRKNWSSLVLWNCNHHSNSKLTIHDINTKSGQYLHRFLWLDDDEIGEINYEWNWLVNWYKEPDDGKPKALHFTEGGPWLKQYQNCEYSDTYIKYAKDLGQ